MRSLGEWRRELKIGLGVLIVAAVVTSARRWLGFTSENVDRIDVLLWLGLFALSQVAMLVLDCAEAILNELYKLKARPPEFPSPLAEAKRRLEAEKREPLVRLFMEGLRKEKQAEGSNVPSGHVNLPSQQAEQETVEPEIKVRRLSPEEVGKSRAEGNVKILDLSNIPEPDFSTGTMLFALLCNKSAIGIYTSYEKAEEACEEYKTGQNGGFAVTLAKHLYQIKPFKLDGPAMAYPPY